MSLCLTSLDLDAVRDHTAKRKKHNKTSKYQSLANVPGTIICLVIIFILASQKNDLQKLTEFAKK